MAEATPLLYPRQAEGATQTLKDGGWLRAAVTLFQRGSYPECLTNA